MKQGTDERLCRLSDGQLRSRYKAGLRCRWIGAILFLAGSLMALLSVVFAVSLIQQSERSVGQAILAFVGVYLMVWGGVIFTLGIGQAGWAENQMQIDDLKRRLEALESGRASPPPGSPTDVACA
jgi:hypothetical protein